MQPKRQVLENQGLMSDIQVVSWLTLIAKAPKTYLLSDILTV
jgi:hypothetical protein